MSVAIEADAPHRPQARRAEPRARPERTEAEVDLWRLVTLLWRGRRVILLGLMLGLGLGALYAWGLAEPRYASETSLALDLRAGRIVDRDGLVGGVSTEAEALNTEIAVIRSRGLLGQVADALDLARDPVFAGPAAGGPEARPAAVEALRRTVSARLRRGTYIFDIRAVTGDPETARSIADTLAALYISDQVAQKFAATETAVGWLTTRAGELEAELKTREGALSAMRAEIDLIGAEGLGALNRQLKEARIRAEEAEAAATRARGRLHAVETGAEPVDLARLFDDPALGRLARSGDAAALAARIDALAARARSALARARDRAGTLAQAVERLEGDIAAQSGELVRLDQAEREVEATRRLYTTFLARLKEATVQLGLQQADARILSAARPGVMVAPQRGRIVTLAGLLGLVAGTGALFVARALRRGYRDAAGLEAATGVPIMGQLPVFAAASRDALLDLLCAEPPGPAVEAIRNLRTSVLLSDIDAPPQVVMLGSALAGEGRTSVAIALAHALSGLGRRVLLIEGDVRRRTLGAYLDAAGDGDGLITAMTGEREIEDVVIRDSRMEVDVLLGETTGVNAADLFSSDRFRGFVEAMRARYDMILIDTPPALTVPDARVIGQCADAILLAVAAGQTGRGEIAEALRQFAMVNLRVTGLVMTRMGARRRWLGAETGGPEKGWAEGR